jgi:DNA-binding transcriptional ArsR family regulator
MDGSANIANREMLQVASDPNRWRILVLLSEAPRTVGELVHHLDVAQPSVSHHLGRLRKAGLVEVVRQGRSRRYAWPDPDAGLASTDVLACLRRWVAAGRSAEFTRRPRVSPRSIDVHLL